MRNRIVEMEVFVAAVARGSLAAAASDLGISAQMAGRYLKGLEARLGVPLLRRGPRRQALTTAGEMFLIAAKDVIAAAHEAEEVARSHAAHPSGRLRITAPASYGALVLAPALSSFLRLYPDVRIELRVTDTVLDFHAEKLDAAFRLGELPDSALIARPLPAYDVLLCAAPSYLAERSVPATVADLADHRWIAYGFGRNAADVDAALRTFGFDGDAHAPALRLDDSRVAAAATLAGAGVSVLPEVLVRDDIAAGRLIRLLGDKSVPGRRLHLVYPDRVMGAAARVFVDWARRELS